VNSAHAIDVTALEKRYGATQAVDGLSFSIDTGEVFGLLGPNGAGKTTTVEILEGYRRADAGVVRVLGVDPWRDGAKLRPKIGVMLQDGGLYPGIRPLEALRLFASYYDNPDDPDRLLDLVGLREAEHTLVRRMSGGQQQRLSLALALVGRPIRELRDRGATVVLTTHAMNEAEQLCDRVGIVHHGRLVAYGSPSQLTTNAGADMRFSAASGLEVEKLARALELAAPQVHEVRPGDYVVDAPATPALVAALAAWLEHEHVLLSELRAGQGSLEDVFLRLTGDVGE
jgi:ABC-2 type transport system ATP-binding protein